VIFYRTTEKGAKGRFGSGHLSAQGSAIDVKAQKKQGNFDGQLAGEKKKNPTEDVWWVHILESRSEVLAWDFQ